MSYPPNAEDPNGWPPASAPRDPGYPGQASPGQASPGQQYPGQQFPGQQYPGQQYPGQQYPGQPYPGQAYPQYPGAPDAGQQVPTPAPRPKRRRGRLIAWIAVAVVLVLLIAGGVVGSVLGTRANAPERQVEAYLSALVDGEAEDALELSGAETGDAGVLLTDEVYGEVEDRISGYTIGESTVSGDRAEVSASITQGDEEYDATFTLEKAGKAFVVFDTWRLQAPELGVVSYTVSAPEGTAVAVSGVDTTDLAPGDGGAVELPALPGTYTVALAGESDVFAAEPLTASVVGFGADAVTTTNAAGEEANALTVTLTDTAVSAGEDAVDAYLDGCAASTELRPEGCPFSAQGETEGFEYSNCVWTLDPRPTFAIGEFDGSEWEVTTESSGSAALECDVRDPSTGGTGTATAGPMDVEVGGAITAFGEDGATYVP